MKTKLKTALLAVLLAGAASVSAQSLSPISAEERETHAEALASAAAYNRGLAHGYEIGAEILRGHPYAENRALVLESLANAWRSQNVIAMWAALMPEGPEREEYERAARGRCDALAALHSAILANGRPAVPPAAK
jgi:hypothetical protein